MEEISLRTTAINSRYNYTIDDAMPRSSPNRFSKDQIKQMEHETDYLALFEPIQLARGSDEKRQWLKKE